MDDAIEMTERCVVGEEQERLFREWMALRDACREYHGTYGTGSFLMKGSPGGAAKMCVCGAGCGESAACNMLGRLRDMIRYGQTQEFVKDMRAVV